MGFDVAHILEYLLGHRKREGSSQEGTKFVRVAMGLQENANKNTRNPVKFQ